MISISKYLSTVLNRLKSRVGGRSEKNEYIQNQDTLIWLNACIKGCPSLLADSRCPECRQHYEKEE